MRRPCGQGQPTPCYRDGKHCEERYVGCQANCERYMRFWEHNVKAVYPRREIYCKMNDYTAKQKIKSVNRGGGKL